MLDASIDAGIEAPIRFYITENADGGTTLSYKTPTYVFAPYMVDGKLQLRELAEELDQVFAAIATRTTDPGKVICRLGEVRHIHRNCKLPCSD